MSVTNNNYKSLNLKTIDKRTSLSKKELIKEYIEPGIPVVLTNAAENWKALGEITPEFFKNKYGHLTKKVKGKEYSIAEFIPLMLNSSLENPAPYPFNLNVEDYFPELLEYIKPEILYAKSDRIHHPLLPKFMLKGTEVYEFFLGGAGAVFPFLHFDALFLHTQITQVYGSKDFTLYHPNDSEFMYPREDNPKISHVNAHNPDYERFPRFRSVTPIKVTVNQGETILFPTGWWHVTQMHEPNISLGRAQLNHSNWDDFVNENYKLWKKYNPKVAFPALLYAKLLGKIMNLQERFQ